MSSSLTSYKKSIQNVPIYHIPLKLTSTITNMIQILEVLQNFDSIQDLNDKAFETVISVIKYKNNTLSFLKEILDYYKIEHNLNKYLSSLSKYKHQRWRNYLIEFRIKKTLSLTKYVKPNVFNFI